MSNTQPEALRLADELVVFATWRDDSTGTLGQSAAELRRLHEANQAMLEALKQCTEWMESLRSSGDAGNWDWYEGSTYTNGLAAIAKKETNDIHP